MNLPKRQEIKKKYDKYYREEKSESIPEAELYYRLLKAGIRGEKQYPIGSFFADIAIPEHNLAIEYDGKHHLEIPVEDYKRHVFIRSQGWDILRVMNKGTHYEVTLNLEDIKFRKKDEDRMRDVYDTATLAVKEYIRNKHLDQKDFTLKYSSGQIGDEPEQRKSKFIPLKDLLQNAYQKIEKESL